MTDKGAGVSNRIEVLLEGSPYPYVFDRDRNFIKLEIAKSLKAIKILFSYKLEFKITRAINQIGSLI